MYSYYKELRSILAQKWDQTLLVNKFKPIENRIWVDFLTHWSIKKGAVHRINRDSEIFIQDEQSI